MIQAIHAQQVPLRRHMTLPASTPLQKGLLVLTVACGALSLIPGLRIAGSLATRSTAFLASTATCANRWSHDTALSRLTKCTKIAVVSLGLVGLAASLPVLITASLIADLGIQLLAMAKALYHRENKAILHFSVVAIDSFTLAGIVLESAPLMLTAAAISAVAMIYFAANAFMHNEMGEGICYIALSLLSCVSAIEIAGFSQSTPITSYFTIKNQYQEEMTFQDQTGGVVATAKPGETAEFSVPTENAFTDVELFSTAFPSFPVSFRVRGYKIMASLVGEENIIKYFNHERTDYQSTVMIPAMQPKDYITLPLGSTVITTHDMT